MEESMKVKKNKPKKEEYSYQTGGNLTKCSLQDYKNLPIEPMGVTPFVLYGTEEQIVNNVLLNLICLFASIRSSDNDSYLNELNKLKQKYNIRGMDIS